MHLFPSPYNTGPQACEGLGEAPESRFSTFVVVSALLHLLVLCSCIDWCRDAAGPLFAGNAVIEIDLVSIPGKSASPAPAPPATQTEKVPAIEPAPEIIEEPAAPPPSNVEETPPQAPKPGERPVEAAPVEKAVKAAVEPAVMPSLLSSTAVNKAARPVASPAVATGKASPESAGGSARTDNPVAVKATGALAQAKGTASSGSVSPGQRYVDETFYYIKDLITRNLTYPVVARRMKWQGTVVVSFTVLENGTVQGIEVVTGSGHCILDKNVIATIEQVQPFPAPPAAAEFTMPIRYTLKP